MNKKNLPLLLMLVSGFVTCVYTFILQYSTLRKLVFLFIVMLFSYLLGNIVVWVVDCFKAESEKRLNEEGEVIEKGIESQEGEEVQGGTEHPEGTERSGGAQEGTEEEESKESGMN